MAEQTPTPEARQADMLLTESVAVPAFAQKLAADYGITADAADQVDLRTLSDPVYRAVHHFLQKRAAASQVQQQNTVKAALDSAFEVAGRRRPSNLEPSASELSGEFFKLAGVADAAALLTGQKAAEEHCDTAVPGSPAPTETPALDDLDENGKKKTPVVAA